MNVSIEDKHVVITGAAGALGGAVARQFAGAGAKLALIDNRPDRLANLFRDLQEEHGALLIGNTDITIPASVGKMVDLIMTPVGGGGLLSGTAIAASGMSPRPPVVAAEPEMADDAFRSLRAGEIIPSENPNTIADGLRTSLGDLTFPIIKKHVEEIVTVSEEAIVRAMRLIWERMKIVVEPSAAVPVGALLTKRSQIPGERIGVILSGGNVDLARLPWQA